MPGGYIRARARYPDSYALNAYTANNRRLTRLHYDKWVHHDQEHCWRYSNLWGQVVVNEFEDRQESIIRRAREDNDRTKEIQIPKNEDPAP